jgi:flagellar FliL protein
MSKASAPAAALEAARPEAAPGAAPPAASAKKRPLLVVAALAVVLVGLGAGGWLLVPRLLGRPGAGAPAKKVELPVKATFPLGAVVVNLDGTRHYVKLAVDLGVPGPKELKEVEEHKAQLLDLVISVVSATPLEELSSSQGRAELKLKLLDRIHDELKLERVARVYFTEFLVQ